RRHRPPRPPGRRRAQGRSLWHAGGSRTTRAARRQSADVRGRAPQARVLSSEPPARALPPTATAAQVDLRRPRHQHGVVAPQTAPERGEKAAVLRGARVRPAAAAQAAVAREAAEGGVVARTLRVERIRASARLRERSGADRSTEGSFWHTTDGTGGEVAATACGDTAR